MQRPADTPPVPDGLDWDMWIGPSPMRPYHTAYHPFSWRAWWDFGAGALGDMACHVMDASYSTLHLGYPTSITTYLAYNVVALPREGGGPAQRAPDPGTTTASRRPAWSTTPSRPAPSGQEVPAREAALVRRRADARAAGRARTRSPAARERHDLRRQEGQDHVRDLLREPAHHPRVADEALQAPEEDHRARRRAATSRTGSRPSRARRSARRLSTTQGRSPRRSSSATWRPSSPARNCCGTGTR